MGANGTQVISSNYVIGAILNLSAILKFAVSNQILVGLQ